MYPKRVKFIGNKKSEDERKRLLYATGLKKNKIYNNLWDDRMTYEIYDEHGTVTVTNDDGEGHEIEKGDYEVKEWLEVENSVKQ